MTDKLYTGRELALKLGISYNTLYSWKESGKVLPLYTAGEMATGEDRIFLYDYDTVVKSKAWAEHTMWVNKRAVDKSH